MSQDQLFMTIVQTQCCQFFIFLIKKELMLQRVVCILCHAGWGESIYKMKKAIYNLKE